jgi:hypothetical protein
MLRLVSMRIVAFQRAPLIRLGGMNRCLSTVAESPPLEEVLRSPVTRFTEDEAMTRDAARQWAQQDLKPVVREMDNEAKLRPTVIQSLFEMGFMGMVSSDSSIRCLMMQITKYTTNPFYRKSRKSMVDPK